MSAATAASEKEKNTSENEGLSEKEFSGPASQRGRRAKVTAEKKMDRPTSRIGRSRGRKQTRKKRRLEIDLSKGESEGEEIRNGNSGSTANIEDEPVSLPLLLFRADCIPVKGRINSYSKTKYILDIVKVLDGTREYEWLRGSCFGKLFDLPCRKCALSGKLVHQFLCRMVVTKKLHEMWFVFGGYPIRFSLRELALLTGLNCQPYPVNLENVKGHQTGVRKGTYWRDDLGVDVEIMHGRQPESQVVTIISNLIGKAAKGSLPLTLVISLLAFVIALLK